MGSSAEAQAVDAADWAWAVKVEAARRGVPMPCVARAGGLVLHGPQVHVLALLAAAGRLASLGAFDVAEDVYLRTGRGWSDAVAVFSFDPASGWTGLYVEYVEVDGQVVPAGVERIDAAAVAFHVAESFGAVHVVASSPPVGAPATIGDVLAQLARLTAVQVFRPGR